MRTNMMIINNKIFSSQQNTQEERGNMASTACIHRSSRDVQASDYFTPEHVHNSVVMAIIVDVPFLCRLVVQLPVGPHLDQSVGSSQFHQLIILNRLPLMLQLKR